MNMPTLYIIEKSRKNPSNFDIRIQRLAQNQLEMFRHKIIQFGCRTTIKKLELI